MQEIEPAAWGGKVLTSLILGLVLSNNLNQVSEKE